MIIMSYDRKEVCRGIWEAGCFRINLETPFRLRSGLLSPYYLAAEDLLSNPDTAKVIREAEEKLIYDVMGADAETHYIAGLETRGLAFAAQLAAQIHWPTCGVRKKTKDYGAEDLVFGLGKYNNEPFILVDDLITSGGSKLKPIESLRKIGKCDHCLVVIDRSQGGKEELYEQGVKLHSLIIIDDFFEFIQNSDFLSNREIAEIKEYRSDPSAWTAKMQEML